jgi:hypothetical protein
VVDHSNSRATSVLDYLLDHSSTTCSTIRRGREYLPVRADGLRLYLFRMLGELVETTAGKWITRPPSRCPNVM